METRSWLWWRSLLQGYKVKFRMCGRSEAVPALALCSEWFFSCAYRFVLFPAVSLPRACGSQGLRLWACFALDCVSSLFVVKAPTQRLEVEPGPLLSGLKPSVLISHIHYTEVLGKEMGGNQITGSHGLIRANGISWSGSSGYLCGPHSCFGLKCPSSLWKPEPHS